MWLSIINLRIDDQIGIGAAVTRRPLPHPRKPRRLRVHRDPGERGQLDAISKLLQLCDKPLLAPFKREGTNCRSPFDVVNSFVQYLPDQSAKTVGDCPDGLRIAEA